MPTPTWTKKDYEFFAQVLNNVPMDAGDRDFLEQDFAKVFNADNYNFDRERWTMAVFDGKLYRGSGRVYGGWTKKTYVMTAQILARLSKEETKVALISAFGSAFERDNPRFDWERFRKAAGSPYAAEPTPVYAPESYYDDAHRGGYRRVRVHQHFRSKPGGRVKRVRVRAHNREV